MKTTDKFVAVYILTFKIHIGDRKTKDSEINLLLNFSWILFLRYCCSKVFQLLPHFERNNYLS